MLQCNGLFGLARIRTKLGYLELVTCSVARLGCFQPHGLFSGFMGLVKFWMGWELVGLDGCFSDLYRKISEILGCFVGKLGWFWDLEF